MRQALLFSTLLLFLGQLTACGSSSDNSSGSNGNSGGSGSESDSISTAVSNSVVLQDAFPNLPALQKPLAMMRAPGDTNHWYIAEQAGRLLRVADGAGSVQVVIDIRDNVVDGGEAGLLGLAFHPQYASNGRAFLSYTRSGDPLESVISEFTRSTNGNTLDTASERIILLASQDESNHNGGQISFGPDQYLYIALGDGGSNQDRSQETNTLLGSFLRIDVNGSQPYEIPPTNPFSGNQLCPSDHSSITPCPEIYAWGFRNPWRWSFDRRNGELWAGDVGEFRFEEINRVSLGGNYGWRSREGSRCFESPACNDESLIDPVVQYGRADGTSVTGGYVYRGSQLSSLSGQYIFGDFGSGTIWAFNRDTNVSTQLVDNDLGIASFAEDQDGELYVLDWREGRIYALQAQ